MKSLVLFVVLLFGAVCAIDLNETLVNEANSSVVVRDIDNGMVEGDEVGSGDDGIIRVNVKRHYRYPRPRPFHYKPFYRPYFYPRPYYFRPFKRDVNSSIEARNNTVKRHGGFGYNPYKQRSYRLRPFFHKRDAGNSTTIGNDTNVFIGPLAESNFHHFMRGLAEINETRFKKNITKRARWYNQYNIYRYPYLNNGIGYGYDNVYGDNNGYGYDNRFGNYYNNPYNNQYLNRPYLPVYNPYNPQPYYSLNSRWKKDANESIIQIRSDDDGAGYNDAISQIIEGITDGNDININLREVNETILV